MTHGVSSRSETDAVTRASNVRAQLLRFVETRLGALRDVAELAVENSYLSLQALIRDDAATPQVGVDGERGVETEWLVDGRSLVLNCHADGTNVLWALDETCQLRFRREFNARMIDAELLAQARAHIEQMNSGVRNQAHRGN